MPLFKWEKLGRMFNPAEVVGHPWIREFSQAPSVLKLDNSIRVYFASRPSPDDKGNYVSLSAYAEFDRHDLFKLKGISKAPLLDLGDTGTFDEFGAYFTSIAERDADIIAYYVGYTRCESVPFTINIGAAISHDGGCTFNRLGKGPLLSCSVNEPFFLTVPRVKRFNGLWHMWYSAGKRWIQTNTRPEPVYHIRMARSVDGIIWDKEDRDLIECVIGEDECQACPDVFWLSGMFHMFFCYRKHTNYHGRDGGYRIGYAYSNDMIKWTRDDSAAGIAPSDDGWDSEMISFPHVFELDGETYMIYLGNQMGRYGFGLARMLSYQA
jgi:hypothetical protein